MVAAGSASRRAQKMPLTARFTDSVPPPVNTTSDGRAPRSLAIDSRDSSTMRRARRPEPCSEAAFPGREAARAIAASASGTTGVSAA